MGLVEESMTESLCYYCFADNEYFAAYHVRHVSRGGSRCRSSMRASDVALQTMDSLSAGGISA